MRRGQLQTIRGIQPRVIPPKNAKLAGVHTDGRQIYRERLRIVEQVPTMEDGLNEGEQLEEQLGPGRWRTSAGRELEHLGDGVWESSDGKTVRQQRKRMPTDHPQMPTGALQHRPRIRYKEVEYVLDPTPNGHVNRQFHFREDPKELIRLAKEEKAGTVQREIAEGLVERDISVDHFLEAVLGPQRGTGDGAPAEDQNTAPAPEIEESPPLRGKSVAGPELPEPDLSVQAGEPDGLPTFKLVPYPPGGWKMPDGERFEGTKEAAAQALELEYGLRAE